MMPWLFLMTLAGADLARAEAALEARLLAPCCYIQTLDAHQSPSASQLRAEVHDRLGRGEPAETIEQDLVARYGERVRAVPRGFSLDAMGAWIFAGAGGLGVAGLWWWRRSRRREAPRTQSREPLNDTDAALDERLTEELAQLD